MISLIGDKLLQKRTLTQNQIENIFILEGLIN